jgi:phospholipid-transporting ATPase
LVCAADYFGFQFCDRRQGKIVILNKERGMEEEMELLETIVFSSKRKKMSVIVRDSDGVIKIFCKGADTAILANVRENQEDLIKKTMEDVERFSTEGLRCLLVGCSELSEQEYEGWRTRYLEVRTTTPNPD